MGATHKTPQVKGMPKPSKAEQAAQTAALTASLINQGVSPTLAGQIASATVKNGNGGGPAAAGMLSEFNALQNLFLGNSFYTGNSMIFVPPPSFKSLPIGRLGRDGKVHHTEQSGAFNLAPDFGSVGLQNLSQDVKLGNTEYALISLWFVFTAVVFGLLYKITNEAVCDDEEEKDEKKQDLKSEIKVEYLDNSAKEALV